MSHMTAPRTATSVRAAAAERQRRRRARLAQQAPARSTVECRCCGRLFVPTRQGRYCSRQCVERAGALRRRLQQSDQLRPLSTWLNSVDGAAMRARRDRVTDAIRHDRPLPTTTLAISRAISTDHAERRRLLQDHRHLLDPEAEAVLIDAGWLHGPQFPRGRYSAMAQADPDRARDRFGGARW